MNDALAPLDRGTLAFWRASNLIGWAAAGLALALGIHWVAAEYSARYFGQAALNQKWEWFTGWGVLPSWAFRGGVSLVIGVALGLIVSRKTWKHQTLMAAGVATAYALISTYALTFHPGATATYRAGPQQILITGPTLAHGFGGYGASGWIHDGLTLLAVPVAAAVAWFATRRRRV